MKIIHLFLWHGKKIILECDVDTLVSEWLRGRDEAVKSAKILNNCGVTKQLCNRKLEAYMYHTVIVTGTEWENFFALRCPKYWNNTDDSIHRSKKDYLKRRRSLRAKYTGEDIGHHQLTASDLPYREPKIDLEFLYLNKGQADIHIMALAEAMWDAMNESTPKELKAGEWHIPFGDSINERELDNIMKGGCPVEIGDMLTYMKIQVATARCAQVSYTVIGEDGKPMDYNKLIALHDRLSKSGHWSPFEHCAQSKGQSVYGADVDDLDKCGWSGNFRGFKQYRKLFPNENLDAPQG